MCYYVYSTYADCSHIMPGGWQYCSDDKLGDNCPDLGNTVYATNDGKCGDCTYGTPTSQ
jgi:hypothetical protein